MTEYNVYIVDLSTSKASYLYTTLAKDLVAAANDVDTKFYEEAAGVAVSAFHVIPTEDDDISRDELIFDYIIEADDGTCAASSE